MRETCVPAEGAGDAGEGTLSHRRVSLLPDGVDQGLAPARSAGSLAGAAAPASPGRREARSRGFCS